jgi:hypothetical protein
MYGTHAIFFKLALVIWGITVLILDANASRLERPGNTNHGR